MWQSQGWAQLASATRVLTLCPAVSHGGLVWIPSVLHISPVTLDHSLPYLLLSVSPLSGGIIDPPEGAFGRMK